MAVAEKLLCLALLTYAVHASAATSEANGGTANRFQRDGLVVDFSATPVGGSRAELVEGDRAEVKFTIRDAVSGEPVKALRPAGWMDVGRTLADRSGASPSCRDKVSLYLKGIVGIRPMLDLNSYFILVLNQDPSISVIDPLVGMTGKTNLYATIVLKRPGADWVRGGDDKRLYVSMPRAGQVAVVDADSFKVAANVEAGGAPTRLALQSDGRYLWVGDDAKAAESGVSVIDTQTLQRVGRTPTGPGHHEIALAGNRYAFVSNREGGTVSVIDVATRTKVKDLPTGKLPISLAYSAFSRTLYVADGQDGTVAAVDVDKLDVVARIRLEPGLGPLKVTPDGRYALAVNPSAGRVHVIDTSVNRHTHALPVGDEPYQIAFSQAYAHVRSLGSERVYMIPLSELGKGEPRAPNSYAAGTGAPKQAPELGLAEGLASASSEAAVLVVNPVEGAIYYYMEGMNAPSGSFRSYGHAPRAVTVVDRSLKEREPGVYSTKVKLPAAGSYDVAFALDTPRLVHCFTVEAKANPALAGHGPILAVEYLRTDRRASVGKATTVRFRLTDGSGKPKAGLKEVRVTWYLAPGSNRTQTTAVELGDGVYEATHTLPIAGAWYVHVAVPSLPAADLPYLTLVASAVGQTQAGR